VIVLRNRAYRSLVTATGLLGAAACLLVPGGASGATAHAARTISLSESGRLHITSHHTTHLNFQGTASGTIRGSIYIHLNVTSQNRVSAEVSIYPSNGSLTGVSTANYHANGGQATFSGTMSISRGTGSYAHAHASNLSFSGTIQRSNDATTVRVSGPLSY
jgi:hypothetical protein